MIKPNSITVALSVVVLLAIMTGIIPEMLGTASAATNSVSKIQSGLVSSDLFTTGNTTGWTFGGTAALHNYYEDSQGLHLGVQAPSSGQWINYYAASAGANAHLFHAALTIPYTSIADGVFNPGLYVEGSNYNGIVGCQAYADDTGYYWTVQSSTNAGSTWTTLYAPPANSLPQTDDCTVMTNGNNYLKVYIGGNVVFSSTTMNLNMPTPLHAFIQVDSSSASMDYSTFSNYYSTTDENIKVTNNPSNATMVKIVDATGNVLATSPVSAGTATLNVGMYKFPLSGTIDVYDSSNALIASSPANIYGGDVYSVSSSSGTPTVPQAPSGLTTSVISSSQINLSWTAPSSNGGSAITGYKIERSTDSGTTWSTVVSNTGSTSTTYSDSGLTPSTAYTYRVSAINSVGTGSPSNTVPATTNASTGGTSIILNNVQSTSGTVSSSPYQLTLSSFNAGTGTDRLLVVGVAANNQFVKSITFGGVSLTKAVRSFHNDYAGFWYLTNPSGTGNIVVTMEGATSAVVGAYSFSGVNQTTPIPTVTTSHSTVASSPTISVTTKYPNSLVLDLPAIYGGKMLGSPTCTQQWDTNIAAAITGASSSVFQASAGPVTCSWTASDGGDAWDNAAIEVRASGTSTIVTTAPGSPTGLTASAVSSSQINLSWTASLDNGGSAITGYMIERSTDGGTTWSTVQSNTGSTATTYSDTGLTPSTAYTYRVSTINSVGTGSPSNTASATTNPQSLTLVTSGLLLSDSLANETKTQQQLQTIPGYWRYGGDAIAEKAPYTFWKDIQGLHTGVQAPSNATWAGVYAVSKNIPALLHHSVITTPIQAIPANNVYYNNGMYVQTNGSSDVNYVTCASNISSFGTVWAVFWATGNPFGATNFTRLWYDPSPNQPLTRDCTIITNGINYLKVYLDGVKVVDRTDMNLQMPSPFNVFLEPQSSYPGQMLNGTFVDYYASVGENVTVNNLPQNAVRVNIADSSGNVLATSPATNQVASLDVGKYHFPLSGTINVYDSNNVLIASSSFNIYGGDVYSVNH